MIQNRLRKHFLIAQNPGAFGGRRLSWPPWDLKCFPDPLPNFVPRYPIPWSFTACILHCSVDVSLSNCNVSTWVRKLSRRTLNKIHTNKTSSLYEFCEWLIFNYMYLMWQVVDQSRFLSGLSIRIIIHSDQLSNFLIWKISHFFSQSSTPKFRKEWTLHGKESFFNCFFFRLRL